MLLLICVIFYIFDIRKDYINVIIEDRKKYFDWYIDESKRFNELLESYNNFTDETKVVFALMKDIDSKNTYNTIGFVFFLFWLEQQGKIAKDELYNLFDKRS